MKTTQITVIFLILFCTLLVFPANTLGARSFALSKLPIGADITLGRPARTLIRVDSTATFAPTGLPQSISFRRVSSPDSPAFALTIALYDTEQRELKRMTLKGQQLVYTFTTEESVVLTVNKDRRNQNEDYRHIKLEVTSDAPLTILHGTQPTHREQANFAVSIN